jgi:acetolactate synthase regulatory subunit
MNRKIYMKVDNGVDTLLRAVSTLRRKEFKVLEVSMQQSTMGAGSNLLITVNATEEQGCERALSHMKGLFDVREITILDDLNA